MAFFSYYPITKYNNLNMRNIMVRASITENVIEKYDVFYPYIVEDGERPDTIAYDYYGDSSYWWVVVMSNNIIDPYYDWPLTDIDFRAFIIKKYGNIATAKSTIKHYEYTGIGGDEQYQIDRKSWTMTTSTYAALSAEDKSGWTPVYAYDYEENLNDAKRSIRLLDRSYIPQLKKELKTIFNA